MSTFGDVIKNPATAGLLALVNPLLGLVPQVAKIFMDKDGSTVPERNVAVAVAVADAAQKALKDAGKPAENIQQVIETIASDPQAKELVRQGIEADVLHLVEAGGGGIAGARTFLAQQSTGPMAEKTWHIVEWVTYAALAALALANVLAAASWAVALIVRFGDKTASAELVQGLAIAQQLMTQVVTADIGAAMAAIGFWLGSSWGSKKQSADEAAAK